jgi:hypothetical protein
MGGHIIPNHFNPELLALRNDQLFAAPAIVLPAGPATDAAPLLNGWSGILNRIAVYAARTQCGANEMFVPDANPAVNPPNLNPPNQACRPPGDLIRYAFGLLYKIKRVLGTDWPDTHDQLTKGGRNSNNNKRNKYTHRKKQYSQRRYKK